MKYLINSNFKVTRKGSHITASADAGEWIYDTEQTEQVTAAQLQEIAKANKLKAVGKKKSEYIQSLNEEIEKMSTVPEQNGPTQTEIVDEIVRDGFAAGLADDDMMIKIISAGVGFKRAAKMFKDSVERQGLRTSTQDVKKTAAELLAELDFKPASYDEVEAAVEKIMKKVEGAQRGQAMVAIKAYAKENEVVLPKREKGKRGAVGFRGQFYDWVLANPTAGEDELVAFLNKEGKDPEKLVKRFLPILQLCQRFTKKHGAPAAE